MTSVTKWYRAAEAKKGRTIHLGGHARLGASYAKCGKVLGRLIAATDAKYFDPCALCSIEQNKQIEREKKRVAMESSAERAPWVPNPLPDAEREADIAMIKKLAEDLEFGKANYPATLESIALRARKLFDDEARFVGRGFNGPLKNRAEGM